MAAMTEAWQVLQGDARSLPLPDASVDAIVTDPPYGLHFMGKTWDQFTTARGQVTDYQHRTGRTTEKDKGAAFAGTYDFSRNPEFQVFMQEVATEALRVAKPGAHLLAFGGTRTHHRLMVALEDAGWEIRDCLMWLFGSGFPKSLDVSKAIDKEAGVEREKVGEAKNWGERGTVPVSAYGEWDITAPATDAARQWDGWGTALKPAYEPVVLARKPLAGTVAQNVQRFGTGALNIDGCRIGTDGGTRGTNYAKTGLFGIGGRADIESLNAGRWPANLALDKAAAALLDAMVGDAGGGFGVRGGGGMVYGEGGSWRGDMREVGSGDRGGPSRFFYTAKASRTEREAGLEQFAPQVINQADPPGTKGSQSPRAGAGRNGARRNTHPTVKPVDLMRWLVRLVTPPGGLVLDPFCGSGSTGMAALDEGMRFVGVDLDAHYVDLATARIRYRHHYEAAPVPAEAEMPQGRLF